jgi:2-isopropylmalate synthase
VRYWLRAHGFGDDEALAAHVFECAKSCDHTYTDAEVLDLCAAWQASKAGQTAGAAA